MTIQQAVYRPTGSAWTRFKIALFTAYVNWHLRRCETRERELFVQLDEMGIR